MNIRSGHSQPYRRYRAPQIPIISAATLMLAACGGGSPDPRLVGQCAKSNPDIKACQCIAKAAQKGMSDDDIQRFVDISDEIDQLDAADPTGTTSANAIMEMSEDDIDLVMTTGERIEAAQSRCGK